MNVELDVQYAVSENDNDGEPPSSSPNPEQIRKWVEEALTGYGDAAELTVRIVGREEIQALNRTYRHKDKPTNVLSFPFEQIEGIELPLLGDIIICAAVVEDEARQQGKSTEAHWAHMVVHGALHLLGYDHIDDREAEEMENLEIATLERMGYENPYIENCA